MRARVESVDGGRTVRFDAPEKILDFVYYSRPGGHRFYDVSRQNGRLLMIRGTESAVPDQITVVLNWMEELKARVPTR